MPRPDASADPRNLYQPESEDKTSRNLALKDSGLGVWDWSLLTGAHPQGRGARWDEILGYEPGALKPGYDEFAALVHPDDWLQLERASQLYRDGKTPSFVADFRMRHKDGSWCWVISRGIAVQPDAAGHVLRMMGTDTDLIQHQAVAAQLQTQTQLLRDTLGSISQGLFVLNATKRVISFNARACELLNLPAEFLSTQPTLKEINQLQLRRGDFGPNASLVDSHAREYVFSAGALPAGDAAGADAGSQIANAARRQHGAHLFGCV
jgi:PAS domain-containing protein